MVLSLRVEVSLAAPRRQRYGDPPALEGERFMLDWQNGSVNNLFTKIRDSMPATYPESVADDVKLDIITYLLQVNSFPAGASDLRLNQAELESIQIKKKGSSGVPNFALVQVVGCLERGPGQAWMLAKTSEPAATKRRYALAGSRPKRGFPASRDANVHIS